MKTIDNSVTLREASLRRGLSKRRIIQQASEGGWGIRKIGRDRYVLSEDEKRDPVPRPTNIYLIDRDWIMKMK